MTKRRCDSLENSLISTSHRRPHMAEVCPRCGDPDDAHDYSEQPTADKRNCNLFRIGTALQHTNELLERLVVALELMYEKVR
mgnify:CR=1 FL=1